MKLGELLTAIQAQTGSIFDPALLNAEVYIDDRNSDLHLTIFKVYRDEDGKLVIQAG